MMVVVYIRGSIRVVARWEGEIFRGMVLGNLLGDVGMRGCVAHSWKIGLE
jgi:hypothetical protein